LSCMTERTSGRRTRAATQRRALQCLIHNECAHGMRRVGVCGCRYTYMSCFRDLHCTI
jgi:hypothetical protein